jgi:hypothetical protein
MSYTLYSFCVAVISLLSILYLNNVLSNANPSVTTEKDCKETAVNNALSLDKMKDGDECDVWDGSSCRRGQVSGILCISQRSYLMLFLLGLFVVSLLSSLYF